MVILMENEQYRNTLVLDYVNHPTQDGKDEIIEEYQWLVGITARRMQRRREPIEDLMQVCNIGLLEALDRFDPSKEVSFHTYASATMNGVLRHHYRNTWRIHIPRRVQELTLRVSAAIETLQKDLQKSPTAADVAKYLHVGVDLVIEAIDAGANFWPLSLSYGDDEGREPPPDAVDDTADSRMDIDTLLGKLSPQTEQIMRLKFYEDCSQEEIGQIVGMSQVNVSRTIRLALVRLRAFKSPSAT